MANASPAADLALVLRRWDRWLRGRRAWTGASQGLWIGLGLCWLLSLPGILAQTLVAEEYLKLISSALLLGPILGGVIAYVWRVDRRETSRYYDQAFRLCERVSTAVESLEQGKPELGPMARLQLQDALASGGGVDPADRVPFRAPVSQLLAGGALAVLLGLTWLLSSENFEGARRLRALQQVVQQEVVRIEEIQARIEQEQGWTEEDRQEAIRALQAAQSRLASARSAEEAISALREMEGQLAELLNREAMQRAEALSELGERMSQNNEGALRELGEELAAGRWAQAAEQIRALDPRSLDPEQLESLARDLRGGDGASRSGADSLARSLEEAGAALRAGDAASAAQAIEGAASALVELGEAAEQATRLEGTIQDLSASRQALLARSELTEGDERAEGSIQDGSGSGAGGTPGAGQAASSQGSGTGGAGRGEGDPQQSVGAQARTEEISQENAPGDGGERAYEPIYAPQWLGGDGGPGMELPPGQGAPGDLVGPVEVLPGQAAAGMVPYVDLLPSYAQVYRRAMARGEIPMHLRGLVRDYFRSLEP